MLLNKETKPNQSKVWIPYEYFRHKKGGNKIYLVDYYFF